MVRQIPSIESDAQRLREVLRYEPETGKFYWRERIARNVTVGAEAGSTVGRRYCVITINRRSYQGHRLAYVYMTGKAPQWVDHINGDGLDNRWANLRNATPETNGWNQRKSVRNKTGVKHVSYSKSSKSKPYMVGFNIKGKYIFFGRFATLEEATEVANVNRKRLHGEYARAE